MDIHQLFKIGMSRELPLLVTPPPGLLAINLGAGKKHIDGAHSLDYPEWDADRDPIPFQNGSVGVIHAYHFLEHVEKPVAMLLEMQRVLAVGGVANIVVPYYTSQMMAHDLDHKSQWCEETWRNLFDNKFYDKHRIVWQYQVGLNVIMGIKERNLALITQLIKGAQ